MFQDNSSMGKNTIKKQNIFLYEVIIYWNPCRDSISYKKYCAETLFNIFNYPSDLCVKLVYEAVRKKKTNVYITYDINTAINIRNKLLALEIESTIAKTKL